MLSLHEEQILSIACFSNVFTCSHIFCILTLEKISWKHLGINSQISSDRGSQHGAKRCVKNKTCQIVTPIGSFFSKQAFILVGCPDFSPIIVGNFLSKIKNSESNIDIWILTEHFVLRWVMKWEVQIKSTIVLKKSYLHVRNLKISLRIFRENTDEKRESMKSMKQNFREKVAYYRPKMRFDGKIWEKESHPVLPSLLLFCASEPLLAKKLRAGDSSPCNLATRPSLGLPWAIDPDRPVV